MRRKLLVIFLTTLLFLSAATLGVSTVFRVKSVTIVKSTVSEAAATEAPTTTIALSAAQTQRTMPATAVQTLSALTAFVNVWAVTL